MSQLRARDLGLAVGQLPTGQRNKITDVPGVSVGHVTIDTCRYKTGLTAILPCPENPFYPPPSCSTSSVRDKDWFRWMSWASWNPPFFSPIL